MDYLKFKKLIEKKVFEIGYQKNYPDYDELRGEANCIFMNCVRKYERERAEFSTYLTMKLHYGLLDFIRKEKRELAGGMEEEVEGRNSDPDFYLSLSDKTKWIFNTLICLPDYFTGRKVNKGEIKKYLRLVGWKWEDILSGFEEMKSALK